MKFSSVLKTTALATALAAALPALAGTIATSTAPNVISAAGVLKLSDDITTPASSVVGAFDVASITISQYGSATLDAGYYPSPDDWAKYVQVSAPLQSLTFDDVTRKITSVQSIGGLTQTVAKANAASSGGFINIYNIRGDLTTKTLYADISGANGLVSGNIAFFNYSTLTGADSLPANWDSVAATYTTTLSGLTLTAAGKAALVQGLGLRGIGLTTLNSLTDFGTLTTTIVTTAVPEPSTYALMGLGFAAVGFVARRRIKNPA